MYHFHRKNRAQTLTQIKEPITISDLLFVYQVPYIHDKEARYNVDASNQEPSFVLRL